ncbi:hypothetical protein FCULG_00003677 [Fusarium culmorum]|uniref:WH2 domain-containing protein n=1 Tax=Fusarium culmorum TaxID=5516 RepID=A0A2T4H6V6_FUSCU|nr:hypothetical protein FCULG_00003677 [Fusarium culmorum]
MPPPPPPPLRHHLVVWVVLLLRLHLPQEAFLDVHQQEQGALLSDIHKGRALKKAVTNDRSAPVVGKVSDSSAGPPIGGAPPVPKIGGAPPVPGLAPCRAAVGWIIRGGMPKLKKRGGGVDTGAQSESSYRSDSETISSAPRPPAASAPRPPSAAAPAIPGRGPPVLPPGGAAGLRKTTPMGSKPPPPL